MEINEAIAAAKDLGIKLTNAEIGTQLYQAWVDRVHQAKVCFDDGRMDRCQDMIEAANEYAV